MISSKIKEKLGKALFIFGAVICIISALAIFVFLIVKSAPAFAKIGISGFIFGDKWEPQGSDTYEKALEGSYGIFTMIIGTIVSTVGALVIGGTLGYFTSIFIVFYCPKKLKTVATSVINILSGIPSVVYGFFGIAFLLPWLSKIAPNNGSGPLATSIILGIMILPTIASLSRVALESVPKQYYEGSVALGSNHTSTVFKIMVPSAKGGIIAALILGIGRALGETMAVVMVAGNSPTYPNGPFNSFRVLTANIVLEMGYAGEVQEGALIATGVVLLMFVLAVNLAFNLISNKKRNVDESISKKKIKDKTDNIAYKINSSKIGEVSSRLCGILVALILAMIILFILVKGLPTLISKPQLIYGKFEFGSKSITILPSIICTVILVIISLLIATPVGIMTAIFLNEYAKKESLFVHTVRTAINILGGVPSIVYGLFGLITFVRVLGGSSSIISGSLTVAIILLPTIVKSTQESLKSVPKSLREASLALGAGKLRTILRIAIPSALPGIVNAIILSIGRVISESAPLLYTMGSVIKSVPKGLLDSGATLSVALYQLSGEGWYINEAYATAVVLIVIVLGLNLLADFAGRVLSKRLKGEGNEQKSK